MDSTNTTNIYIYIYLYNTTYTINTIMEICFYVIIFCTYFSSRMDMHIDGNHSEV